MGKSQRTKGAVFEREVAALFNAVFPGHEFKRNIGQARDGGHDLDVGPLVVECKRRASLKGLRAWVLQAQVAAASRWCETPRKAHIPIVVMREDQGEAPLVLMSWADFLTMTQEWITTEGFRA